MTHCFIREKKIYCGKNYREIDIIPMSDRHPQKKGRAKKKNETAPRIRDLNEKYSKRYFGQLFEGNFGRGDYHVTCTYTDQTLPATLEDAERIVRNYLRRLAYAYKKKGKILKYLLVTEYTKADGKPCRIHHHIIINGSVISRDEAEALWSVKGKPLGTCNADRLQPDENGLAALAGYLQKQPGRKKRWSCSCNLDKPFSRANDTKYRRRTVVKMATAAPYLAQGKDAQQLPTVDYWHKQYPGWRLVGYEPMYNELTDSWSIYLKMRRIADE